MNNIIIWGAGRLGMCALSYYRDIYNVECFVDSNASKWGTVLEGIEVKSPAILYENASTVVVANKHDSENIIKELVSRYGKKDIYQFKVDSEQVVVADVSSIRHADSISLRLTGGLGNQMFQYALLCAIRNRGKRVFVRNTTGEKSIKLVKVFPKVMVEEITKADEEAIVSENVEKNDRNCFFAIYKEKLSKGMVKRADESLIKIDCGIIQGLFQTRHFAQMVREELMRDFSFQIPEEAQLNSSIREIKDCNSVAIHIRLGDYFKGNNKYIYGDICTEDYYRKAIDYIRSKVNNPVFYVFSNDVDGAKNIIKEKNIRFLGRYDDSNYEDWFDMYLMSQCKHSIIANSTFSWWGAWLNQNEDKIVVAPSRWINTFDYEDIYPSDWVVID